MLVDVNPRRLGARLDTVGARAAARGEPGDQVIVHFTNELPAPTTIHGPPGHVQVAVAVKVHDHDYDHVDAADLG